MITVFIPNGNFPTDEFCAELPLQNVINNSPRCVEYVLLKNVLLLILSANCCGTHKNKKTKWVSKESYFQTISMQAPTFNTVILIRQKFVFLEYHIDFLPMNFAQSYHYKTLLITHRAV